VFRISLVYYLLLDLLDQEAFISISPIHENICLPFITICLLDAIRDALRPLRQMFMILIIHFFPLSCFMECGKEAFL